MSVRAILAVVLVAAIIVIAAAAGWFNDKAKPGTSGRGTMTTQAP
jgi:hypothetical protein